MGAKVETALSGSATDRNTDEYDWTVMFSMLKYLISQLNMQRQLIVIYL